MLKRMNLMSLVEKFIQRSTILTKLPHFIFFEKVSRFFMVNLISLFNELMNKKKFNKICIEISGFVHFPFKSLSLVRKIRNKRGDHPKQYISHDCRAKMQISVCCFGKGMYFSQPHLHLWSLIIYRKVSWAHKSMVNHKYTPHQAFAHWCAPSLFVVGRHPPFSVPPYVQQSVFSGGLCDE